MPFRLGDADRERFGVEEWLEMSTRRIPVADLEELSERFDFDPGDWPDPFVGVLTLDQAGDPDARPKAPRWRPRAVVWMLLRQNGVAVSWEDAGSVAYSDIQYREPVEEVEAGKENGGSPPSTDSPPSAPSTTRRSRSSSTSPKRKSTS